MRARATATRRRPLGECRSCTRGYSRTPSWRVAGYQRSSKNSAILFFSFRACPVRPRPADEAILRPGAFRRSSRRIPLHRRRSASRVRAFTHSDCSEIQNSLADECGISPTLKSPAKGEKMTKATDCSRTAHRACYRCAASHKRRWRCGLAAVEKWHCLCPGRHRR